MQIHIAETGCCRGCSDCGGERINCHQSPCLCTVAGVIEILQREAELFDDWFMDEDGNDYFPGQTMRDAAKTIKKLKSQVEELFPYMERYVEQGLAIGPPPEGHNDECEDCVAYHEAKSLAKRIAAGEFRTD